MRYYVGLDIGGTKCGICVGGLTENGDMHIVESEKFPTAEKTYVQVLENYAIKIEEISKRYKIEKIGIVCGGPLNGKKGIIQSPPNLPGWDNVAIVRYFEERFVIPARLENDANACAVAEWKFGAGKGTENLIFMTFGTGLGTGLIINGKLYSGTNGNAGEIGHIRLEKDGPIGFNKSGSAEGFCSGNGIRRLTRIRAKERNLEFRENVSAKDIFEKARKEDEFCISIVRESAEQYAKVLSILIDLFNPDVIVSGGIFMRNYDMFMPIMEPILKRECLPDSYNACKILPSQLGENIGDYSALAVASISEG